MPPTGKCRTHTRHRDLSCTRDTLRAPLERQLLMGIQRYGASAEIIAPAEPHEQMRTMLAAA